METINTILGIVASLLSILAVIWSGVNAYKIKKITSISASMNTKTKGKAKGGDGSVNVAGQGNAVR